MFFLNRKTHKNRIGGYVNNGNAHAQDNIKELFLQKKILIGNWYHVAE